MFSPLRTALVASALVSAFCGAAEASVHRTPVTASNVVIAAVTAGTSIDSAEQVSLKSDQTAFPAKDDAFTIPVDVRRKLAALEAAGNMPNATADLQMWGGSDASRATAAKRSDQIARFARGIVSKTSRIALSLTRSAMRFIGTPYVFGGTSPSGFDCSGYVQHVFAMLGIALPRTADAQYYAGKPTVGGMKTGDLVFFQTYCPGPSHVGIYLGHGKFISSSGHGVSISHLSDSYWAARYIGAKRYVAVR